MPKWSDEELEELKTLPAHKKGAVAAFAKKRGRNAGSVAYQLGKLRMRGVAKDVRYHRVPPELRTRARIA